MLYYERFTGDHFSPSSYDANYCGSSESWNSASYNSVTSTWNINYDTTNFANWDGWSDNIGNNPLGSSSIQSCGTSKILGGYGKYAYEYWSYPFWQYIEAKVTKSFTNLPVHSSVDVEVNAFQIDTWDSEYFIVSVDSTEIISNVWQWRSGYTANRGFQTSYCGQSSAPDAINQHLSGSAIHTSTSSLNLYFFSDLDQDPYDESWGFKDLYVYLNNNCHCSCITCSAGNSATSCTSCPSFAVLNLGQCTCMNKYYMEASAYTHCAKCHYSCATCTGPLSSNCASCYTDFTLTSGSCVKPTSIILLKNTTF